MGSNPTDLGQAETYYSRLVRDNANNVEGWLQLGLVRLRQAKHAAAIEALDRAAALDPRREVVHHYLGICHQALRQLDRAAEHFARVIETRPDWADAHNNLGITHAQLRGHEQAAACFEQALRVKNDFPEAHNNYGNVLGEQGRLDEAAAHYRQALTLKPDYAEAHNNLGVALRRRALDGSSGQLAEFARIPTDGNRNSGEFRYTDAQRALLEQALACFRQAAALNPRYVEAHLHLGEACNVLGKGDEAITAFRQLLTVKPDHADAAGKLAVLLSRGGRHEEAAACLQQLLLHRQDVPEVYHTLGMTLGRLGRLDDSAAAFRQALRLRPGYAEALNNLGNTLLRQQKLDEAIAAFRQALTIRPDYAHAHSNLGSALLQKGAADAALAAIEEALRLDPDYVEGQYNRATALRRMGRMDKAVAAYERVIARRPRHAEAHCGLGAARTLQGRAEEALACFERALEIAPDDADFHTNRGLTLLLVGDWERGWEEYEWRLRQKRVPPRLAPQPTWDGSRMPGGTVLVYAEQGMGDTIQFVRYLPLVKERVGTVLFECPAPLRGLLEGCAGVDGLVDGNGAAPAADVQVPLMSLPRIFGTRADTIPAGVPYVFADALLRAKWRRHVALLPSPQQGEGSVVRVGIAWQGNPKLPGDQFRSVKLTQFAPLAEVPGVQLYSMQKGIGAEQVAALDGRFPVVDLASHLAADFRDTAAAIDHLDLVIAVDTSVAHLAGALGKPVWVLLPINPDWRWQRDGDATAWYPTVRLFRQRRFGDWDEVFARVAAPLAEVAASSHRSQTPDASAA